MRGARNRRQSQNGLFSVKAAPRTKPKFLGMERLADSHSDGTVFRLPRVRAGEVDLVRILRDRSYRQRFLDELEALRGTGRSHPPAEA